MLIWIIIVEEEIAATEHARGVTKENLNRIEEIKKLPAIAMPADSDLYKQYEAKAAELDAIVKSFPTSNLTPAN